MQMFNDSQISMRPVTHSADKVCYIGSVDFAYDTRYLDAYDFEGYGYAKVATAIVDVVLAVRSPPANANKFKKRQGAKATKKLKQLESVRHEVNLKEATAFRVLAARCNYVAQYRADIAYSAKKLCREFAIPNKKSYE